MGGNVFLLQPRKIGAVAHGEDLGQEAVERTQTDPSRYGLAVKYNDIAYLMTELTSPLATDDLDLYRISAVIKALADVRCRVMTSISSRHMPCGSHDLGRCTLSLPSDFRGRQKDPLFQGMSIGASALPVNTVPCPA